MQTMQERLSATARDARSHGPKLARFMPYAICVERAPMPDTNGTPE
jgi:hypothetical protein